MKRHLSIICLIALSSLLLSTTCFAAGYAIYEHGANAVGMAGAYTAIAQGPYANFYNPAGITYNKGLQIGIGTALIKPVGTFTNAAGVETEQESQLYYPSHFYLSYQINEKLAAGFGFFSPFGLGTEWPADWAGKYRAIKTNLETMYFNPSIAYQVSPKLSVAVGFSYILSNVELGQKIPTAAGDVVTEVTGDGNAMSFNFGLMYKASEKLSAGLSYRHSADFEYDGDVEYTLPIPQLAPLFVEGSGEAKIHTPYYFAAGISYKPIEKWTFALDLNYYGWSGAKQIDIKFDKAPGNPAAAYSTELTQKYDNTILIRFGAEYQMAENLFVRGGYIYDQTPVKNEHLGPTLPDANRNDVALGLGYKLGNIDIDLAYLLVLFAERVSENVDYPELLNGKYNTSAHLFNLSFGYSF